MRQIALDIETTGKFVEEGDRIIEIACIELKSRQKTGNDFHCYINPNRDSHPEALKVHGLTTEFLSDKPEFSEVADAFCQYIQGAELLIHNAPFDVGFLDAELKNINLPPVASYASNIVDTLVIARDLFPGRRNGLDALCERYEIDNSHRELHGAMIDADLLVSVYLAMTRGQNTLDIDYVSDLDEFGNKKITRPPDMELIVRKATPEEEALHEAYLDEMAKKAKNPIVWRLERPVSDSEEKPE